MTNTNGSHDSRATPGPTDVDVVVVGAGMAGMYLLHRLRGMGFSTTVLEAADDVGGTWYWNRYPGARCDIQSIDYSYSFDPELEQEWEWSEKYATQPEILRYMQHVADRHDLRRDIQFETRVTSASWDDATATWGIVTDAGETITTRWYVMATGCLSMPKTVDIDGFDRFAGPTYFNSRWPHEGVDFTGMRVGLIGTGSSAIQSIPVIAEQASELVVFQRTPNFSVPAGHGPVPAERLADIKGRYPEYRQEARESSGGVPLPVTMDGARTVSAEERQARLEDSWKRGDLLGFLNTFSDSAINQESNDLIAGFVHDKIRGIVDDPATAEALCPTDHPIGTKRLCLDDNYFATYNEPHVSLVNLRTEPIATITETGVDTADRSFEFDALVFATGFDAMTGAIVAVDITGRNGIELKDKWADGPTTYLGLTITDFPNFFTVTGPQSPSVLSNMAVSIEQHVEWITNCIAHMRDENYAVIEPTTTAQDGWQQHTLDCADITLFPKAKSWYMGANVPGKPRVFLPYIGGVGMYRQICDDVTDKGYVGFALSGPDGSQCNDGLIREAQPDVSILLHMMSELELPAIESLSPVEARGFMAASAETRPPGPEVGEIVDGVFPGAAGELAYRLYRPATPGPHQVVVYFHGGGWVLGGTDSDDPLCRDLCVQSNSIIVSCDYRHAPEARFPAAVDDGYAAVVWATENLEALGGQPNPVIVAGWSAGGTVAAVACQTARDANGPAIAGQVLITPATDCDFTRPSYTENAEGFVLTRDLMNWFWDHYCDAADRSDPRASPINGKLDGLPPTFIATAQFDPLRDEGSAYAEALEAAGVRVEHLAMRGQMHTSMAGVDMIISANDARAQLAQAIRGFTRSSALA